MKFYLETYGCQMNVADSELVTTILLESGNQAVIDIKQADVIIFNTCSVRKHAEDRVLGRIANERNRKKDRPDIKIGIIGCMAQRIGEELTKKGIGIDFAVGVDQYDKLPYLINHGSNISSYELDDSQLYNSIQPSHANAVCGFVTIMRGCNNFCSYCIVPYVRGRERSRSYDDIANDVQLAADKGIRDITLLGQNVNSYYWNYLNFPTLLTRLARIDGIFRLRFITSHPKDLTDELIDVMATSDKVCEHIHLPMQSGDNEILKKMNRNYAIETYLNLVSKLRNAIPRIAITTDIIAGFPNETERQFKNTLAAVQQIGFDYAFCFKYSNRLGTSSAMLDDQLTEETRLSRLKTLINLQRLQTKLKFDAMVGTNVEVLIEGESKLAGEQLSGKTRDFKICVLNGDKKLIGHLVKTKVIKSTPGTLIGEDAKVRNYYM
jgi:tRNA-2-methylthio-N6-dimethylallyladenosine synthase